MRLFPSASSESKSKYYNPYDNLDIHSSLILLFPLLRYIKPIW